MVAERCLSYIQRGYDSASAWVTDGACSLIHVCGQMPSKNHTLLRTCRPFAMGRLLFR
jgi:hypothetical protein